MQRQLIAFTLYFMDLPDAKTILVNLGTMGVKSCPLKSGT